MTQNTENFVLTNATVWLYSGATYTPQTGVNVYVDGSTGKIDFIHSPSGYWKEDVLGKHYKKIDMTGKHLFPGAIDTHIHGISDRSVGNVTEGIWNIAEERFDDSDAAILSAYEESSLVMAMHGTTSWIATTMATEDYRLQRSLTIGRRGMGNLLGAELLGFGIEGTFLYPDDKFVGAQTPAYFRAPTLENYMRLVDDIAEGDVRWVGIDPRWVEGDPRIDKTARTPVSAIPLVRYLTERNILVGLGHSGAHEKQVEEMWNAVFETGNGNLGGGFYIHMYQGPNGSNFKPGQGLVLQTVVPSILDAKRRGYRMFGELIVDRVHHHMKYTAEGMRNFGIEGTVAITDNIGVGPESKVRRFTICNGKAAIDPSNPMAIWKEGEEGRTLFGSRATTMDQLFPNIINILGNYPIYATSVVPVFDRPFSFDERVDLALQMLCRAPSLRANVSDRKGVIAPNFDADLVAVEFKPTGHPIEHTKTNVTDVWVRGRKVK